MYCIFETFMTSICERKKLAKVRLIHAEQISLYNFIILRKNNRYRLKNKQVKQDISNQWDLWVFLYHVISKEMENVRYYNF